MGNTNKDEQTKPEISVVLVDNEKHKEEVIEFELDDTPIDLPQNKMICSALRSIGMDTDIVGTSIIVGIIDLVRSAGDEPVSLQEIQELNNRIIETVSEEPE